MDEQGDHGVCDEVVTGEDGITKIIVTCPEFEQSYNTRSDFMLLPENRKLVISTPKLDVYFGNLHIIL